MTFRNYDPNRDREAVHRIWREVGWLEKDEKMERAAELLEKLDWTLRLPDPKPDWDF